jgi:predicted nucleic acid-binding protein
VAIYLDSSALIKLVVPEAETGALLDFMRQWPDRVSSVIARIEVGRAARRIGGSTVQTRARAVLAGVDLVRLDDSLVTLAAHMEPATLRSLDAVHLATAISLGQDVHGMAVYDKRLAAAARTAGIAVWAPT